ncbi:RNHCP domain protein [compost metagenome]
MSPIDIYYHGKKGYQIIHKCKKCGKIQKNKIAQDTIQADNIFDLIDVLKKVNSI